MKYLFGADIGTTSLKAAVFDENGKQIRITTKDYTLIVNDDRVEFPTEDYFQLFENNLVDFVASDIHVDRKYCSQKAYRLISKKYGKQVAEDVFVNNAKKLILS